MNKWVPLRRVVAAMVFLSTISLFACDRAEQSSGPIRLVDRFAQARIEDSPEIPEPPPPIELDFRGELPTGVTWAPGPRTAELRQTAAGLEGRSTGPQPALFINLPEPLGKDDRLHEVEIRLRASKGELLSFTTLGAEGPPSEALGAAPMALTLSSPLLPGGESQTYSVRLDRTFGLGPLAHSDITRVLVRPTDAAGAEFTLESIRLVFRKQMLASISTGIGWQGLSQVWRDTVIAHAPETFTWSVALPASPWLDVALGTVSNGAVGFEVRVAIAGREAETAYAETLTTAEVWRPRRIDLSPWAGRIVELTLAARGPNAALAFWGSPVIRDAIATGRTAAVDRPRGVIVVLADTLRKHHLEIYGHDRANTPNLARMAAEGVLFRDAISQATWTKVSVPSILSSMFPSTHQIVTFNDRLPSAAVTLAEALQEAGFATWASSSVPFSGQLTNLHQGVEVLHEEASVQLPKGVSDSKTGRYFIDELVPWLEQHRDVPFFAFVHAMDPHSPFRPYPPYDTMFTDAAAGRSYDEALEKVRPHIKNPLLQRFGMPTRAEMQVAGVEIEPYLNHERAWYDASILALDMEIGRLREALDRLGRAEDTVIAFVSDHGEEFLEHGNHWHGLNVYAEMIEVPLLLHWPGGLPPGTSVDIPVKTIDLMPTLLELAGVAVPETAQGTSLRELWSEGGAVQRRSPVIAERKVQISDALLPGDVFLGSDSLALVESDWKLIWNTRRGEGVPEYELYHRPSDPLDQKSVAGEQPEEVQRLASMIERWLESAIAARLPSDEEATQNLSAEELERLKSLGYL